MCIGDSLLRAVDADFVEAVRLLCEYAKERPVSYYAVIRLPSVKVVFTQIDQRLYLKNFITNYYLGIF